MNELDKDAFTEMFKHLPEGKGINVGKMPDYNISVHVFEEDELRRLADDSSLLHMAFWFQRPGVHYFANYLEHVHFLPDTPVNDEFEYRVYKWKEMLWGIITIPLAKKHLAEEAAEVSKMRLANGVPMISKGPIMAMMATRPGDPKLDETVDAFPMATDNVFTLENKKGDVLYDGPGGRQDAKISEEFKIKKLWKECGVPNPDDEEPDPWET